jgi:glutaredoxin
VKKEFKYILTYNTIYYIKMNKELETFEFTNPSETCYTIYSKSGCPNCTKVKELLQIRNIPFVIINCDDYLLDNKPAFLEFIMNLTSREWKTFPIVFDNNSQFIGGFIDTKVYLEKLLELSEDF